MPVYEKHVFVCTRGEWCPSIDGDGIGVHAALKEAVRAAGLSDRIRINHAGCFSQCGNGPMAVVYPEGTWYAALTPADVPEIVERHLVGRRAGRAAALRPGHHGRAPAAARRRMAARSAAAAHGPPAERGERSAGRRRSPGSSMNGPPHARLAIGRARTPCAIRCASLAGSRSTPPPARPRAPFPQRAQEQASAAGPAGQPAGVDRGRRSTITPRTWRACWLGSTRTHRPPTTSWCWSPTRRAAGADGLPPPAADHQVIESAQRLGWADAVNLGLHRARGGVVVLLDTSLEPTRRLPGAAARRVRGSSRGRWPDRGA